MRTDSRSEGARCHSLLIVRELNLLLKRRSCWSVLISIRYISVSSKSSKINGFCRLIPPLTHLGRESLTPMQKTSKVDVWVTTIARQDCGSRFVRAHVLQLWNCLLKFPFSTIVRANLVQRCVGSRRAHEIPPAPPLLARNDHDFAAADLCRCSTRSQCSTQFSLRISRGSHVERERGLSKARTERVFSGALWSAWATVIDPGWQGDDYWCFVMASETFFSNESCLKIVCLARNCNGDWWKVVIALLLGVLFECHENQGFTRHETLLHHRVQLWSFWILWTGAPSSYSEVQV